MNEATVKEVLGKILDYLGLPYESFSIKDEGEFTRVDITSNDPSRIIGWHGETLNSIQHLLKAVIRSLDKLERSPFLVLDVDGYRRAQEDKVRSVAEQKADFVRRTGNRVALSPMSPYFRRIVHLHVANSDHLKDLTTESTGEGDYRQIVLKMKEEKAKDEGELSPVIAEDDGLDNLDI